MAKAFFPPLSYHQADQIAMVRCKGGGRVSVFVGGKALHEYQIEEETTDELTIYTCYIEAKDGDEYEVRVDNFPVVHRHRFLTTVYVDGKWADVSSHCGPKYKYQCRRQKHSITFTGYDIAQTSGERRMRTFTFSKVQTTDDVLAGTRSPTAMEDYCTIQVQIEQEERVGEICHKSPEIYEQEVQEDEVLHEDSKPAAWGMSTAVGQERTVEPRYYCNCSVVDDATMPVFLIIFKYLPHDWLVAKGLKKRASSEAEDDDDVQIDLHRTQRSAEMLSRRRAREEDSARPGPNTRVKTETKARARSGVKVEKIGERERPNDAIEVLEPTGAGDFVLHSGKMDEAIGIEDDLFSEAATL